MNIFFQSSFKSSIDLIENQKNNTLLQNEDDSKIKEENILSALSIINKEISFKYRNLINKYHEIIVKPFNTFTTDYKKFY